jgi:DNA helicase-2/ATP-dependent DNA helicase PcrA
MNRVGVPPSPRCTEAARGAPPPPAGPPSEGDLFQPKAGGGQRVARTPAESVRLAIEGWYGAHLRTLFPDWREREDDLQGLVGFASRFEDLGEMVAQVALLNGETSDKSPEPEEDTLRLTTIHQSKGLEFPVVMVIGVAEGLLPLQRAVDDGDIEEERRLFYVACTRAMDQLHLFCPRFSTMGEGYRPLGPSPFLDEMDPSVYEVADYTSRRL